MRIIRPEDSGLSEDTTSAYIMLGQLPDGRICGIHRLMYHFTLHLGITDGGHEDRYCLKTLVRAQAALLWWNGVGDPPLFHKYVGGLYAGRSSFNRDVVTGVTWPDNAIEPTTPREKAEGRKAQRLRMLDFACYCMSEPTSSTCECGQLDVAGEAA